MVRAKVAQPKRNYQKLEMGGGRGVSFQGKIEIKIENKAKRKGKFN